MRCYKWHVVQVMCVAVFMAYGIPRGEGASNSKEVISDQNESCEQSPVQQNVTLRGGINAGTFKKLAQYVAMQLCIRMCCEEKGCDVALMSGKNCYGIQCYSEELCRAVPAKKAPSSLMISHVTIKGEEANNTQSSPATHNLQCTNSPPLDGVTLRGGLKSGNFTDVGTADDISACSRLCCVSEKCDLAMVLRGHCFLVACFTKELCETVKTHTKNYRPTVAYVRRWITNATQEAAITLSNLPEMNSKLMCKNSDIKYNSTLKGGHKAGNFTDLGKVPSMTSCIRMCCGRKDCDVAMVLENNCYAVNCYNNENCQPVHARRSGLLTNLRPQLSYITSRSEEVLPEKIAIGPEMSCRPGVISYDVTLKGGLSAGSFFPFGNVDNMEACVTLCCQRNSCSVAFMLKDACFSITCASEELCEQVPAPSTDFSPRLSYVRREHDALHKKEKSFQTTNASASMDSQAECTNSEVLYNVTLRGGVKTGKFRDHGKVSSLTECVDICCRSKACDVAFMLRSNCFSVSCYGEKVCEAVRARSSSYNPKLVYIYARTKAQDANTSGKQARRQREQFRFKRRFLQDKKTLDPTVERRRRLNAAGIARSQI